MEDLEQIISDSIQDIELPADPLPDEPAQEDLSLAEPAQTAPEAPQEVPEVSPLEVSSPAIAAETAAKPVPADDFDKKYGLTPQSASGRENRIPYSRVKKIAANAEKAALDTYKKEIETSHVPATRFQEAEAKVKDYEGRLQNVAQFEDMMLNRPVEFLRKLVALPQYSQIFNQPVQPTQGQPEVPQGALDPMPEPDQALSDGSKVYSMDGLRTLLDWQARQVESRVTKQVESRYKPLEDDYLNYQQQQAVLPVVQQQIATARQWPLFNESEAEIVKVLEAYPNATLEQAYQHVVLPKMQEEQNKIKESSKLDRDKMRAELLAEIKQAPKATSVSSSGTKSVVSSGEPRSIEDVIADAVKTLPGR